MNFSDRLKSLKKSLDNLTKTLDKPKTDDTRDLAIKRFELCFELAWKSARDFLRQQGIQCKSPKDTIKESFKYGLIKDSVSWDNMLEDRNLAVHTYEVKLADKIYNNLKIYLSMIKNLFESISNG